ncbi:ABC transporter permease [Mycobacterium sp. MYCO198283]|uniref:ABC transporter permease n=1 Tax=Mycobacterium sp. MYCO198283 TaxID=2883505 RepID=UPI001E5AEB67|nr:ABC transporter permease [Mycobacterium sp. MYCO198283]MCG5430780.1 ABC transporter permease [Mycobacterium sp. MYCO198283]
MTAVLSRPHPAHEVPPRGSAFTGTAGLLRLYARRDRVVAPLWVLLLSVPLATVYVTSIESSYPTAADRAQLAATIMASPAQRAFYGQIYDTNLGAVSLWKAGAFHLLIAVAVILTVIRHTRADEEAGRTELLDSTVVGRYASLTAALLLAAGASLATGLIGALGLLTTDVAAAGGWAFGAALAGSGLVFTGVAAVAAQLSPGARAARGAAFAVLATAFVLRAVGDAGAGPLSWLSPLGWSLQVRPFAGDRWPVLLLHLVATALLVAAAYLLLARRDVGAGLIAERAGRPTAGPGLRGPLSLAWRLNRGTVLVWTTGLTLYGLLIGSVVDGIGDEIGGGASTRDIVERLGGTDALEDAFITIAFIMLAMVAAACAVSLTLRPHAEESAQRAEAVLSAAVARRRWLGAHVLVAVAASAAALLCAGVAAGLSYGAATNDVGGALRHVLATAAVQLPAVWLFVGVGVLLFGIAPRFAPAAWAVLVAAIALYLLGSLSGSPQWLLDLVPFAHTPRVGADFRATPLVVLLAAGAALGGVGAAAFGRRDLR